MDGTPGFFGCGVPSEARRARCTFHEDRWTLGTWGRLSHLRRVRDDAGDIIGQDVRVSEGHRHRHTSGPGGGGASTHEWTGRWRTRVYESRGSTGGTGRDWDGRVVSTPESLSVGG